MKGIEIYIKNIYTNKQKICTRRIHNGDSEVKIVGGEERKTSSALGSISQASIQQP